MPAITKAWLQEQLENSQRQETILSLALNDVVSGEVQWFRKGEYRLGVSRPASPVGGIVLVTFAPRGQKPLTSAYYWERWYADAYHYTGNDKDTLDLRELAGLAQEYINTERAKH